MLVPRNSSHRRQRVLLMLLLSVAIVAGAFGAVVWLDAPSANGPAGRRRGAGGSETLSRAQRSAQRLRSLDGVHRLCSTCHVFPPATSFAKDRWPEEVDRWFAFADEAGLHPEQYVSREAAVSFFESAAPERLDIAPFAAAEPGHGGFRSHYYDANAAVPLPGISNVKWVARGSASGLDCLVCDMRHGMLLLWEHDHPDRGLTHVADVGHPARVEVVDLDRDGNQDLLVADLGSFLPTEEKTGRVLWLRRDPHSQGYHTIVLADHLGRVADARAADFDGDGDLDIIVAAFGWQKVGGLVYLENRTTNYDRPDFRPVLLDGRTGAIHVPIADLNGDGRPDFVVLFSQQHEAIVAFLNEGGGTFRRETLFEARDPAFGSTGIELVDLDGDGDLDVLLTNGDLMDSFQLKPYHGVHWLENDGHLHFRHHRLLSLPGVHRAVAGDLDGDGDLDIVAVAFVPDVGPTAAQRETLQLPSIVYLEQVEPGRFVPHYLESVTCDHATVDLGDYDGDGDLDFVTGYMTWDAIDTAPRLAPKPGRIAIWENRRLGGRRGGDADPP